MSLAAAAPRAIELRAGMVIDRSVTVRPGVYRLTSRADLSTPAILVRGSNVVVDFSGATLAGGPDEADPDTYAGVGILVDGGANVTIRNATIRGYKVGILARGTARLHLTRNDLSFNWKQRLYSGVEHESLVDWMSNHNNEKDEWLRYGAAMYLDRCPDAEVDHNTVTQGQNGLMLTRSDGAKVWNNSFTFLSAIGIGLYRSSRGLIAHNKVDWCVRGYSHGFYNRGQDSAGILMYEQSSGNRVARNSVTHGGDGLFLWAGQSTMDTGQGGCNDNVFYANDFSHAPANGIETTFSRNTFLENRVEDNWHGVWGGYSFDSTFARNRFARNTEGIAIEHGQNNVISQNSFDGDETAISLWQNATQDPAWGYPKRRDTASHGYVIEGNTLSNVKTAFKFRDTRDVMVSKSTYQNVETISTLLGLTPNITFDAPSSSTGIPQKVAPEAPPALEGGMDPMIPPGGRRGREFIIVDEWGPYDFRSPKLWPAGRSDALPLRLRVLGPEGTWRLARADGATVEPSSGRVPGEIVVTPLEAAEEAEDAETDRMQRTQKSVRVLKHGVHGDQGAGGRGPTSGRATVARRDAYARAIQTTAGSRVRVSSHDSRAVGAPAADSILPISAPPFPCAPWSPCFLCSAVSVPSAFDASPPPQPPQPPRVIDFEIELQYRGAEVVSPRGARVKAGDPYRFGYRRFFVPIAWTARFFTFDDAAHPVTVPDAFRKVVAGEPATTVQVDQLDYISGRALVDRLPRDKVALVANGEVTLPEVPGVPSAYELLVISDDGVRVWVDDALVIDRWTEHESIVDRVPIAAGRRRLKVEYFELTGFAELRVQILKTRSE